MAAFTDYTAAQKLEDLCEEHGISSPEALAIEIKVAAETAPWGSRGTVDAWTLRQQMKHGRKPASSRIRFVVAHFFGLRPDEIWAVRNERRADDRKAVGR